MSPGIFQNSNSTSLVTTSAMTSSSTQPVAAKKNLILKPVMTLEGHEPVIEYLRQVSFVSYFPDGKGMISESFDKTTRRWDLQAGKEIEEARDVCEQAIRPVAMSSDGQWLVTSSSTGGDHFYTYRTAIGELKARDVETRIMKTFEGNFGIIHRIDVSADNTMLVGGSWDGARIWSLKTGKLMAGPFRPTGSRNRAHPPLGMVRFSQDSKKLAVLSETGRCLEVWDVQTQKLDVKVEESRNGTVTWTPIFWTTKDKSIVAAFSFKDRDREAWELESVDSEVASVSEVASEVASVSEVASALEPEPELDRLAGPADTRTIYEFNALTLKIVGAPFEGHTDTVTGLALSFDCALLASASRDRTFKLWAFKSRQLLASFDDQYIDLLIFSPNSHQLAYTNWGDTKIYLYDPPRVQPNTTKHSDLLNSDATRRAACRNPATLSIPPTLRPPPTIHPQQHPFLRYFRKLLPSRTNAGPPIQNDEPRHSLDFPATSPLPHSLTAQATTQTRSHINPRENYRPTSALPTTLSPAPASQARLHHLFTWWPVRIGHAPPPTVEVPLAWGELRHAAGGAPPKEDDMRREEDVPSPPPTPDSNSQPLTTEQTNTSEHGSGRWCGCF